MRRGTASRNPERNTGGTSETFMNDLSLFDIIVEPSAWRVKVTRAVVLSGILALAGGSAAGAIRPSDMI